MERLKKYNKISVFSSLFSKDKLKRGNVTIKLNTEISK